MVTYINGTIQLAITLLNVHKYFYVILFRWIVIAVSYVFIWYDNMYGELNKIYL